MLIWKRITTFGKSKHIAEVLYDEEHNGLSIMGLIIGPRGGGAAGAVGLTMVELDEIVQAIKTGVPVIKEG
jgi:hypothetical protein